MNRAAGDSCLIAGVCFFGSWTVYCYAMVLSASSFSDLMAWSFVPLVIALGLWAVCTGKVSLVDKRRAEIIAKPALSPDPNSGALWALVALFISALTLRIFDNHYWPVWILLLCSSMLVFRCVSTSPALCNDAPVPRPNGQRAGIVAFVLFGIVLVAVTHRVDPDDSQYLNFVVTAMDFPLEPLFSHSGLWQDPKVPLELPIYKFHTYELLVAALSDVFGVHHKTVYYLILAPVFGGIAVLLHWKLAQHLVPQYAFSVLLAWLVLMIALGESHREFGNFALSLIHI